MSMVSNSYETIVIGGGQAGLATGYYLQQEGQHFVILDGSARTGDPWRARWDSLHLFTPAKYDSLPGLPFPGSPHHFPTKDEMADYLEGYGAHFSLPIEHGAWVQRLVQRGDRFRVETSTRAYEADNVVVAMSSFQVPWTPPFAAELNPDIVQIHAGDYRNPAQLQEGPVLIVGAGNSGSEIGLEVARTHPTWMSGREVGHVPFRIETLAARYLFIPFVLRVLFHRVFTVDTPIGRRERSNMLGRGGLLVRVKPQDLVAAGVERVPRTSGVRDGLPVVGADRVLNVRNVIWCTGFRPSFSWIDVPVFGGAENPWEPEHDRGIVSDAPGLYFVGLFFLYAMSSTLVGGVARDAQRIVRAIAARTTTTSTHPAPASRRGEPRAV